MPAVGEAEAAGKTETTDDAGKVESAPGLPAEASGARSEAVPLSAKMVGRVASGALRRGTGVPAGIEPVFWRWAVAVAVVG